MTIHVHKSLYKLLTTRPHRGRSGKRSWAYRFTVHVSEPDGASERNPLSGSTKGAALSGLTGSRLSVTKLWCLIYVAAHSCCGRASCSPGTASRSGGHSQACWAVFMCADGPPNQRQNAPPLISVGLAASQPLRQVSGPPGGAAPLTIYPLTPRDSSS